MTVNEDVDLKGLKPLESGDGFSFNYQPSRLDRNALFAINKVFCRNKVAEARTKFHRAHLNVNDLRDDLLKYGVPKARRKVDDAYYAILESVDQDIFGDTFVVPYTHGAVAELPDLPRQKSPGLPLKLQGYKTKGDAINDPKVMQDIRKKWYAIERREDVILPDVACYARAQVCTRDKNKIRATWGYPLEVFLTEAQYFYPLLRALKERDTPKIAYGIEIGNGGMDYLQTSLDYHKGKTFVVGDWSSFDKTVPPWLIRDAFKILMRHIDMAQVQSANGTLWPVRPSKTRVRLEKLIHYFINTPIQMSTGERFLKVGGIPSGSCFTNVIDGIINAIVTRYTVYSMTNAMPCDDLYLGDDFVCIVNKPLDLELFSEIAKEEFSMIFNVEKSYQTGRAYNVHFLGYFNIYGYPYKPIDTIIVSSLYPERLTTTKFETVVRLVGQAYSCFDPIDASNFFRASKILQKEIEGLTDDVIHEFIHDHPHWFKYLQTIGVSAKTITIPDVGRSGFTMLTQPRAVKKRWKKTFYDLPTLMRRAFFNWTKE